MLERFTSRPALLVLGAVLLGTACGGEPPTPVSAPPLEGHEEASEIGTHEEALASGCVAQPTGMKWQTAWDNTNVYFATAGLSQAGPYFYNEPNTNHVGCTGSYPQYYAIDWFMSYGANVYSSIPGKVIWAGESPNPYNTLGKYVAVEHWYGGNRYVAIHAHLSRVFVVKGQIINDSWDLSDPNSLPMVIIGEAGRTDVPSTSVTHLHHSTFYNPSFDSNGEIYGGRSVKPTNVRCFGCNSGSGGYYTAFSRGARYLW